MKRSKLILNDLHIGVNRVAGATPVTAAALRARLLGEVRKLLFSHLDKDAYINGDLFDAFEILLRDAFLFYMIACNWLDATYVNPREISAKPPGGPRLVLGRGNHDIAKDSSRLSVFDLVAGLLAARYPDRVTVVAEPTMIEPGFYMIPHIVNQELFNLELERAIELPPSYILLHANFNNHFAVESDHSLNVSLDQATTLTAKGHTLIFGHEHQSRNPLPRVIITGNQFPSSVADCLGNEGGEKCCIVLDPVYNPDGDFSVVKTWSELDSFTQLDWRDLDGSPVPGEFIRVTGHATSEEAAKVLQVVSKLRQKSEAYVVTNAVKIAGVQDMAEIQIAAEEMKALDVLEYLYENLDPPQIEVVKRLLTEHGGE